MSMAYTPNLKQNFTFWPFVVNMSEAEESEIVQLTRKHASVHVHI